MSLMGWACQGIYFMAVMKIVCLVLIEIYISCFDIFRVKSCKNNPNRIFQSPNDTEPQDLTHPRQ